MTASFPRIPQRYVTYEKDLNFFAIIRIQKVRLPYAGAGTVVGDEVLAGDVARLEVAAVEANRGHAAIWELQAAETLEIGVFHGQGSAVCIRVSPEPKVGHRQDGLDER
ncbi:hypothetical protein PG994_013105 [Apiospora phragmitis]|uniref:Uncharacterized protein n=1 Tax=Apiospora phragmitis TaxID=2905665 RepID=A0ABR1T874_9PEZI